MPAFTQKGSTTFNARMAKERTLENTKPRLVYNGMRSWGGFGWAGFGWNPLFFGTGFTCDPFSLLMLYADPFCIGPAAYWYGFDPFLSNFYLSSYPSAGLFYGGPISPLLLGSNCLLCTSFDFQLFTSGMPGPFPTDPYMTPLESASISISNGALPGLLPTTAVPAPATLGGETSSYTYANPPATGEPVTLVLKNGARIQATQYRLSDDGWVRYVTAAGKEEEIAVERVNLKATMNANSDKGVNFLVAKPQQPKPR